MKPTIIFFGSFLQYSAHTLKLLNESEQVEVIAVVTTPPRPAGRKKELRKTQVHEYAESQRIPVYTPEKLNDKTLEEFRLEIRDRGHEKHEIPDKAPNVNARLYRDDTSATNNSPDLFVVAGYGKLLPKSWLAFPKVAPINIHFSLLPKYRGAMPGEWAILMDEQETGISVIEMSPKLDAGNIVAKAAIPIESDDTREILYDKLYDLGGKVFLEVVDHYINYKTSHPKLVSGSKTPTEEIPDKAPNVNTRLYQDDGKKTNNQQLTTNNVLTDYPASQLSLTLPPLPQPDASDEIYARKISKDETFIPWPVIEAAMAGQSVAMDELTPLMQELPTKILTQAGLAQAIERMVRGLYGWPGVWTKIQFDNKEKRMKIHSAQVKNGRLELRQVQLESETSTIFGKIEARLG